MRSDPDAVLRGPLDRCARLEKCVFKSDIRWHFCHPKFIENYEVVGLFEIVFQSEMLSHERQTEMTWAIDWNLLHLEMFIC